MYKNAAVYALPKGVRTFMQALGGGLLAIPVVAALTDLKATGIAVVLVLVTGAIAGIGAFAQNFSEELERLDRPTT